MNYKFKVVLFFRFCGAKILKKKDNSYICIKYLNAKRMRYYIIAGEASGDLHSANLMNGLYAHDKSAVIRFRGGERMQEAFERNEIDSKSDGGMAFDYRSGAVMGIAEVLGKLKTIAGNMRDCKNDIKKFNPDVLILVDYPGFNLKMAEWAHGKGFKVFWYIAPKVWASREWRIKSLKKYVDRLFIVFPFEQDYFKSKGMDFIYCGNPVVDAVEQSSCMKLTKDQLRGELGLDTHKRVVALLAGSRMHEVRTMMPLFREVIGLLEHDGRFNDCQYVIAGAPGRVEADYGELDGKMKLIFGKTQMIVRAADCAVINSGTASLEAALLGTPQVVAYKVPSRLTYWLAKHFLFKAKYISLANLCLDKTVFREFYQAEGGPDDCNARNVAAELVRLLSDEKYRMAMLADYKKIRSSLAEAGASERIALEMISELISPRKAN